MSIEVKDIHKSFGQFKALDGVSLHIPDGSLLALLGPSGSGKTTLLRIIAGLEQADPGSGQIHFHGNDVINRTVAQRRVGFVFQHYALFRHMTVFENIAFGLRVRPRKLRPGKDEIRERVHKLLSLVQLENLAGRYPSQLSGGQRQRVALARALIIEPQVLLLDEPFGALDAKVRRELRRWLRQLHEEIHVTSLFVTHDQEEALEVADRVVIMDKGRIVQEGTPEEVYDHPATPFVYEFLGSVNLFHSRLSGGRAHVDGVPISEPTDELQTGETGRAYVRPQDFEVFTEPIEGSSLPAVVNHVSRLGRLVRLDLTTQLSGQAVEVELSAESHKNLAVSKGDVVYLRARKVRVYSDAVADSLTSSQL
jgi:sulfate transport system ATP-binding protein